VEKTWKTVEVNQNNSEGGMWGELGGETDLASSKRLLISSVMKDDREKVRALQKRTKPGRKPYKGGGGERRPVRKLLKVLWHRGLLGGKIWPSILTT